MEHASIVGLNTASAWDAGLRLLVLRKGVAVLYHILFDRARHCAAVLANVPLIRAWMGLLVSICGLTWKRGPCFLRFLGFIGFCLSAIFVYCICGCSTTRSGTVGRYSDSDTYSYQNSSPV